MLWAVGCGSTSEVSVPAVTAAQDSPTTATEPELAGVVETITTTTMPSAAETMRVEAKLYDYLVAQEVAFGDGAAALVDGRLASTLDGVEWTFLPEAPELSGRTWIAADASLLVALDDDVLHVTTDLESWTSHVLAGSDGPRTIPAMGGRTPLFVNHATNQAVFLGRNMSGPPVPTAEDRVIYEWLLDLDDVGVICSVDVQFLAESTISFQDCAGQEVASWVEPRDLPQSVQFEMLSAAGIVQDLMWVVDLESGDTTVEPLSTAFRRGVMLPVDGGVVALNRLRVNETDVGIVEGEGSHFIATWSPVSGWTYGSGVYPQTPAGANSPLQQSDDGAIILSTDEGPRKILID